jgi:ATP-dependent exoDNAse (exonuclease V) alpha subunit
MMNHGAAQKPLRHLTMRVAWQTSGWDGHVCDNPAENTYCLALKRIREERDDTTEAEWAEEGLHFKDIKSDLLPPCKAENSYFMSKHSFERLFEHPYANNEKAAKTHGQLVPTKVKIPSHSAVAVPFWWMNRDNQQEVDRLSPAILPSDEKDPFPKRSPWIFSGDRQEAILNLFFNQLTPKQSLVFFYTKEGQPVNEHISRLIVGLGAIDSISSILRYDTKGGKAYPLWDRVVSHSIREDGEKGFLLPYSEYLRPTGDDEEDSRRQELLQEIIVEAPAEHRRIFSYGSELAEPDIALTVLVRCLKAVRLIQEHGIVEGPWSKREDWINDQIAQAWKARGAFPGLGSALEALGLRYGTALSWDLYSTGMVAIEDDPWPLVGELINGRVKAPHPNYVPELQAMANTWKGLKPDERELLSLISRFDLSPKQAKRWFDRSKRTYVTQSVVTDEQILSNPYIIVEKDLGDGDEPPVSIGQIDRGLMPDPTISKKNPIPDRSSVDSPNDQRRIRALMAHVLKNASEQGDSLLSVKEVIQRFDYLDLGQPCNVSENWIQGNASDIAEVISILELEVHDNGSRKKIPSLQLTEIFQREQQLRQILLGRAGKSLPPISVDWKAQLISTISESKESFDPTEPRHQEALDSQALALQRITTRRTSVLAGRAGTGKTSVLGALLKADELLKGGVLLLAPTGKARVRLGRAAGTQALTVAQFLKACGRYDGKRQRVLFTGGEQYRREKTIVIDECSMLTLDDLAAVLSAIDQAHVERLILVGDPNQLPPIGGGRPFTDWIAYLEDCADSEDPKKQDRFNCMGKLTVEVRSQAGAPSDSLRLASWFTRESQPVDADRILSDLESNQEMNDLEVCYWSSVEDLKKAILDQFEKHLGITGSMDHKGFNKALGFNEKGLFPFDEPDGVENFQLLSPVRMQPYGVYDLNRWIQRVFRGREITNAHKHWGVSLGNEEIVVHDKVIHLRNQWVQPYDWQNSRTATDKVALANGEIGLAATDKKGYLNVFFAGRPWLSFGFRSWGETRDPPLELAYALTVHKSQGSDFNYVFVVVPKQCRLLSKELLYTALTRSKKQLILFIEGDGPGILYEYTKPEKSETVRRCTNLFLPVVREAQHTDPYAHHLIHRVNEDLLVRSKSELVIASILIDMGIDLQYERPLEGSDGRKLRPDFSFTTSAGDIILWEHLGMLSRSDYRASWEWKLAWYQENGYFLGDNLFTTEDDVRGGLDASTVRKVAGEIQEKLSGYEL